MTLEDKWNIDIELQEAKLDNEKEDIYKLTKKASKEAIESYNEFYSEKEAD